MSFSQSQSVNIWNASKTWELIALVLAHSVVDGYKFPRVCQCGAQDKCRECTNFSPSYLKQRFVSNLVELSDQITACEDRSSP
jgi:hypothetical protein